MNCKRLARMCWNFLVASVAVLALQFPFHPASELNAKEADTDQRRLSHSETRNLVSLAQPKLKDASGWAEDILWALQFSGLSLNAGNVCALIATVDQESNFKINPPVEGLGRRATKALNTKLEATDLKSLVLRGIFAVDPSIEKRLFDRLRAARTERDIDVAYRKLIEEILTIESIIELDKDFGLGAAEFLEAQN